MRKLTTLFLSVLLFISASPTQASASSNVSSKDFKLENGEMIEIAADKSLLPPLEELIPSNAYLVGIPSNTKDFSIMETGVPVDYIAVEMDSRLMSPKDIMKFRSAITFIIQGEDGTLAAVGLFEMAELANNPFIGDLPIIRLKEVRYLANSNFSIGSEIEYNRYWELVDNETISNPNGGRISQSFSTTSGFDITKGYELSETIGLSLGLSGGLDWIGLGAELNTALTQTFYNAQTITESQTKTTEYNWGNSDPNGIPYIGGLYQLVGEYKVHPNISIWNEVIWAGIDDPKFKPVIVYPENHYRLIQADYLD